MTFLDLYSHDQGEAVAQQPAEQLRLPAGFDEGFHAAWDEGVLFRQSVAHSNARQSVMQDYVDQVEQRTGRKIPNPIEPRDRSDAWAYVRGQVAKLKPEFPDIDDPPDDAGLDQLAVAKSRAARGDYLAMDQREKTLGGAFGFGLAGFLGAAVDPVNILALPVAPAEGASFLATGLRWAAIGGVSQAAIEVAGLPYREQVQPGYAATGEPLMNIGEGAVGAGAFGVGLKGLGAAWTRLKTGQWPRSIRDAGNVVESEANIQATNRFPSVEGEVAHRTALQDSIENLINGRPINVDQHVTPSILAAYEERLSPIMDARARATAAQESALSIEREGARLPPTMERLSEVVLSEIRGTARAVEAETAAAHAGLDQEAASIEAARVPLVEQQQGVVALRADTEKMRGELAAVQEKVAAARPATDEVTQARLTAIEDELKAAALSSARKSELLAERSSITETLAKTAKLDERAAASLAQEQRALEKALARQEKALARAETAAARAEAQLASRTARLPRRRESIEQRGASRAETVRTEMRRTIARLAQEGYGLRLPPEVAHGLAERALGASDEEIGPALREITEGLVDRSVAARAAAAPELPGFERPSPQVQQQARAGYWTEEMRKGVTALAREVGYEMPREEAASIAAAISKMDESEALAVLDEMMLRPRTITETLPGTANRMRTVAPDEVPLAPVAPETAAALVRETSPERLADLRKDPDLDESILRDLDRLRAEKGDIEVPTGTMVGADGKMTAQMRKVDDVLAEADQRIAAAKEIEACVGPQPEAAE